jgi:hypothetical protein
LKSPTVPNRTPNPHARPEVRESKDGERLNARAQRCKDAKRWMGLKVDRLGSQPTGGGISFYGSFRCRTFAAQCPKIVPLREDDMECCGSTQLSFSKDPEHGIAERCLRAGGGSKGKAVSSHRTPQDLRGEFQHGLSDDQPGCFGVLEINDELAYRAGFEPN